MNTPEQPSTVVFIRNFVFGVEDSLVSTVGLLSGVAAAGVGRSEILLSGTVLICVEAFSMGVGSFLSESSTREYEQHQVVSPRPSCMGGLTMFISYFISGFIPLFPYIIFDLPLALWASISASFLALFLLGAVSAYASGTYIARGALRMLVLGGLAVAIGIAVGQVVR
ncbi:MAG: hypothetical protein A3I44_03400 [Candidatus Sungbacteria bacterium RIFCSPLOWO2_02_FULL_51_17]|uniref:VIT family protein n=1 Tax=Candidatus Sungbacteria bacterium RIFCSPHIGHO2_02_FULL_51_29 TaxID=1802273 RepID=A0A1G2KUI8_9BACT|nr:MAG: hypothetical protein A2676_01235 [Candidatus Sungbacteria bacterium RIFCSPHIGHO2_01_FULL_51_22]OHA02079.1 MAG: hypothetical protein A3C16_05630 [Candidatus Sungbacteria bacterium RIFCSPHIGHO2_02_FULL_51_29]OHA04609.1 MAG: hypothetical protein A3B29_04470 [Candidatus Sungbacteria bacterium RIFCSPLOWO2_01_FULL_51_34]OHA12296.1 MAG: hypothetical protein A3I44_03400 [Candidatus Sungbacteria bacterium RIFCSPLOWO2_02_FULL_51_17]